MTSASLFRRMVAAAILIGGVRAASAQQGAAVASGAGRSATVVEEFLIGPEDVIGVVFWRDKDMSGDVTVRPDGIITLALVGEVRAAGLTPSALAEEIQARAARYLTEPNVTVIVRQINSRKVYITGEVKTPGAYALTAPRTVMQAIALAGGVLPYAKIDAITVLRVEGGQSRAFRFSYRDVSRGRNLQQNFSLHPGDTIVVP